MKILVNVTVSGVMAISMVTAFADEPRKMKMTVTAKTPNGTATPDKLDICLGSLASVNSVRDAAIAQKVYDNFDFQQAAQVYLNSIQIASMSAMRKGILIYGSANTTALLFENLMGSMTRFLTPNTASISSGSNKGRTLC